LSEIPSEFKECLNIFCSTHPYQKIARKATDS
jgi:hypothetical protein